jgi:hypothetical protein
VNHELKRIWKKAVVAYLKIFPQHLPGATKENREIFSQDSQSRDHVTNQGLPEQEVEPRRSIKQLLKRKREREKMKKGREKT